MHDNLDESQRHTEYKQPVSTVIYIVITFKRNDKKTNRGWERKRLRTDIERDFWGVPILYSKHGGYPNVHMC